MVQRLLQPGRTRRRATIVAVVVALAASPACTADADRAAVVTEPAGTGACDGTDTAACLLPWPSDRYTRADATTPTGRRLDLPADGTPANTDGIRVDVTEWNRNDGYSPSSIGITVVPDLDIDASALPAQGDIGSSLDRDANLAVVDVDTGARLAAWAETDTTVEDPAHRVLRVVPAAGLPEGHRIAIGARNLVRTDGTPVPRSAGYAKLVDEHADADQPWLQALEDAGLPPEDATIAWSFTVASADGLSGRLRHMWDETRTDLGDGAPAFRVTSSDDAGAARIVRGTFDMPRYLQGDGGPGSAFANDGDPNGIPTRQGTMTDEFVCIVPKSASSTAPAPFVLYGHGLLGSRDEALDIGSLGASVGIGFCAVDWLGMSTADLPAVAAELADLSKFRAHADRMQQGQLGFLLLGRLLASAQGFGTDPAFQDDAGRSAIATGKLSFLGASQGGILGGAASALTSDWNQVILAVGGMGYNLLLDRSVDFDKFVPPFQAAYPDALDRAIALQLIQNLWDRGENTAYAQHLTAQPYPGVRAKNVMLLEAFGDHQVANVSTEKLARTIGAPRRAPTLADGRSTDSTPFFGIDTIASFPHRGSGLIVWDFGTPAPPAANTPPRAGSDPHGKLADVPAALGLVVAFIPPDGAITNACGDGPCRTP